MYSLHFYTSLSNVLKHLHTVFFWPMFLKQALMVHLLEQDGFGPTLNKLVSMFVVLKEHECR